MELADGSNNIAISGVILLVPNTKCFGDNHSHIIDSTALLLWPRHRLLLAH